jgi:hypothetical protein
MTGPIDPTLKYGERRQSARRAADMPRAGQAEDGGTNLPVVIDAPTSGPEAAAPPPPRPEGYATFAAHLYGQSGQRRGLRGGQPVLDAARSAYLETEYSGPADRRPSKGVFKKTEI